MVKELAVAAQDRFTSLKAEPVVALSPLEAVPFIDLIGHEQFATEWSMLDLEILPDLTDGANPSRGG